MSEFNKIQTSMGEVEQIDVDALMAEYDRSLTLVIILVFQGRLYAIY